MNYIYCIVNKKIEQTFGEIGAEDKEIYTIPYKDISLVVHDSNKEPLLKESEHIICHQYVINIFTKMFNTVLPFAINTFIKKEKVESVLEKNYEIFKKRLENLKDKSEFIVQIFYNPEQKKAELKGNVKDYILQQKKLRRELIDKIAGLREKFYNQLKEAVNDIRIRADQGEKKPLLSVLCLVHKDNLKELERLLKKISSMPEFKVCLSGPWAVYSFA